MLVLSRKIGEVVTIGSSIKVTVLGYDRGFVKLGIEAPRSVPVHRQEVYDRIRDVNHQATQTERQDLQAALKAVGLQTGTTTTPE
jgi:carbon storage regulator